jgi:hypothetical protein
MPNLYMFLIGASPRGRNIEQHDVFFAIGNSIKEVVPDIIAFWPEAKDKLHLDAWREVTKVNEYAVSVINKEQDAGTSAAQLFFINLGGYKKDEFEEFHYKMLVAAPDKGQAVSQSKKTAFFRHTGFKGANSHVDDKYGVDVDDVFEIKDILPAAAKQKYSLQITPAEPGQPDDQIHLGYFKLDNVDKWATIRSDAAAEKSSPE